MDKQQDFGKQPALKQPPWRRSVRILLLILFCTASTALSTWVALSSLKGKRAGVLSISPIQIPAHVRLSADSAVMKAKTDNIRRLRRAVIYMDSLARSPDRAFYDSLMAAHPGLADSLALLQSLYPELTIQK